MRSGTNGWVRSAPGVAGRPGNSGASGASGTNGWLWSAGRSGCGRVAGGANGSPGMVPGGGISAGGRASPGCGIPLGWAAPGATPGGTSAGGGAPGGMVGSGSTTGMVGDGGVRPASFICSLMVLVVSVPIGGGAPGVVVVDWLLVTVPLGSLVVVVVPVVVDPGAAP